MHERWSMPRKQRFKPNRKTKAANEETIGRVEGRPRPAEEIVAEIDADATGTAEATADAIRALAIRDTLISMIASEEDPAVALSALTGLTRYVLERAGVPIERYAQALLSTVDRGEAGPPHA